MKFYNFFYSLLKISKNILFIFKNFIELNNEYSPPPLKTKISKGDFFNTF